MKKKFFYNQKHILGMEVNVIEAYIYLLHKTENSKKSYFVKKSKKLYNSNHLICPISIPQLELKEQFEFNLSELENSCGFAELKNFYLIQKDNFIDLGRFINEENVKTIFHGYSIDVTDLEQKQVKQLREPDFDYLWISEEALENHMCNDEIVYSGLVFCYTKFLLHDT